MPRGQSVPGAEAILKFYDARGPRARIGAGTRPALLIVDFTNAFTRGIGSVPGGGFDDALAQTLRLIEGARERKHPIFYTTIAYRDAALGPGLWTAKIPWLADCTLDNPAIQVDDALGRRPDEPLIAKRFPSAFFGTDLDARLNILGIDTLVLAGCTTSVCVRATAIDAMQNGYRPLIAAEAVADFDAALHAVHLRDLDARYADVMSVDDLLSYLATVGEG